jgi:hypothetical protein
MRTLKRVLFALVLAAFAAGAATADEMTHSTAKFAGPKANTGMATHSVQDGKDILTLSDDFVTPMTPDPHVQVVDSKGTVYLLGRCKVKASDKGDDKIVKTLVVPAYVPDIAKVQIYCAWAETVLGEASFDKPVKMQAHGMAAASR